jgi:hypothetical protein
MKQKLINPNKHIDPLTQEKLCDHELSHSTEEMSTLNIYWLAYSYPFVPIIDLTMVFDELKKIVKKWFLNKRDHRIMYKKKINETI